MVEAFNGYGIYVCEARGEMTARTGAQRTSCVPSCVVHPAFSSVFAAASCGVRCFSIGVQLLDSKVEASS